MKFSELFTKSRTSGRRPLRRTAGITAALAGAAVSLGVATPSPAQAADVVSTFRNQATNGCLDASLNNYKRTWPCYGDAAQRWNVHAWRDGTHELRSLEGGWCLDDSSYGLRTYPCNSTTFQSWYLHYWDDGTWELRNQATGKCLDDSSYGLRTFPCNATTFQSWFRTYG
ncbi:RICIN domain-containing protein [Streptomyces acidicola]|nr:RICIN domain-containing protein [Streptomyces acidicola]